MGAKMARTGDEAEYPVDHGRLFPWSRFAARIMDVLLFSFLVSLATRFGRAFGDPIRAGMIANILFYPIYETALVDLLGWTPGKALMNVRLVKGGPGEGSAFGRAIRAHWFGMGTLIPFLYLATMWVARRRYMKSGRTTWDDQSSIVAIPGGAGPFRWAGFLLALFLLFFVMQVAGELYRGQIIR